MTIEPTFKKMLRDQPWDFKTKNEYEEVTLRQQPYVHMHYRNKFDERDYDNFDPRYTRLKSHVGFKLDHRNNRKKIIGLGTNGFSPCPYSTRN